MPKPQLKSAKDWLWYLFCGGCMGAADVVPGVSGGTMAFILGFYEDLITNVKNINPNVVGLALRLKFKELSEHISWQFLLLLIIGILSAIAALSQVITHLLNDEVYRVYLYSGFFGLILASVIFCARKVDVWSIQSFAFLIIGTIVAFTLTNFSYSGSEQDITYDVSIVDEFANSKEVSNFKDGKLLNVEPSKLSAMLAKGYINKDSTIINSTTGEKLVVSDLVTKSSYPIILPWIVFCGAIGVSAMLLPGISGSYLLTILGTYPLVIGALADFVTELRGGQLDWDAIILLSNLLLGILLGAALFSRVISWLFKHYHHVTVALLVGFMVGALKAVWPFWTYTYQLIPLKLSKGPKLITVAPYIPELDSSLLWAGVLIAAVSFVFVFCMEIIALRISK